MLQRTMQSMQKAIVISRIIVKSPQLPSIPPRSSKKRNCNSQDCMCTAPADMLDIHCASSAHQISIEHNPPRRRRNKNLITPMLRPHHPLRTTPTAPTTPTTAHRGIRVIITAGLASRTDGNRDSLHNAAVVMTGRVHTVIDGEIAANQVRAHSGAFASENL